LKGEVGREGGSERGREGLPAKKGIKILNLNSTADTSERGERKKDIKRGEREREVVVGWLPMPPLSSLICIASPAGLWLNFSTK
jgi:hypothetical protein